MSDHDTGGDDARYACKLCQVNEATDGELCENCAFATQGEELYPGHVDVIVTLAVPTRQLAGVILPESALKTCDSCGTPSSARDAGGGCLNFCPSCTRLLSSPDNMEGPFAANN